MAINDIYKDIASRSGGNVYVGVVGPVRSGKSTFVTKVMEKLVLPNVDESKKNVAIDELPQSGSGKTITTTEPKFVPAEGVSVTVGNATARFRLVDCVGYGVNGALGLDEDGQPRKVKTPWNDEPMPLEEAAEYGTDKVINEHSTIGVVVTTDGSFSEIPRENYVDAERRVIEKLKKLNKPFIVVVNSAEPDSRLAVKIADEIEKNYGVKVFRTNVLTLDENEIADMLLEVLYEFPVRCVSVRLPDFLKGLPFESKIIGEIFSKLKEGGALLSNMRSVKEFEKTLSAISGVSVASTGIDTATGRADVELDGDEELFYRVVKDETGEDIDGRPALLGLLRRAFASGKKYEKISYGMEEAEAAGYGVVAPALCDVKTEKPRLVKKSGGSYCVKIRAEGESTHIINATVGVDADVVTGSKAQCEAFLSSLEESEDFMKAEVFGRPIYSLVGGELNAKCSSLNDALKGKVKRIVTKAVNEGKNNLICILL